MVTQVVNVKCIYLFAHDKSKICSQFAYVLDYMVNDYYANSTQLLFIL